jgi:hypothetical protein
MMSTSDKEIPDISVTLRTKRSRNEVAMNEAIIFLKEEGVWFSRPDPWMLKFGDWSWWPAKRRLYRDGEECSQRDQGIPELRTLLRSLRHPKIKPAPSDLSDRSLAKHDRHPAVINRTAPRRQHAASISGTPPDRRTLDLAQAFDEAGGDGPEPQHLILGADTPNRVK